TSAGTRSATTSAPSGDTCPLLERDHAARCRVLGRIRSYSYECSLRPCIAWCSRPRSWTASPEGAPDLHDFGFLVLQKLVDVLRVLVGQLLHALFRAPLVVGADLAVVDQLLQVLHRVSPDLADCDAVLLRESSHDLDELFPPLFGQLRDRK